jgi:hypothetical protein
METHLGNPRARMEDNSIHLVLLPEGGPSVV